MTEKDFLLYTTRLTKPNTMAELACHAPAQSQRV